MKKIFVIVLIMCCFIFATVADADVLHKYIYGWSITAYDNYSSSYNWTAKNNVSSGHLYIKSKAYSPNQGVTQYYVVAPSSSANTTGKFKVGDSYKSLFVNMVAVSGHTYAARAERWDWSLNTDISQGHIYIYNN